MICAICHRADDMQPSQWGHPSVLLCHNPPCIYRRTLQASGRTMLSQPLSEVVGEKPPRQIDTLTAEVLCLAGERTAIKLVSLLGDGSAHTADECLAKLGMTAAMLRTTVKRVRRRGFEITTWPRTRFRALSYELVSVPVLMPDRAVA